jgi:integrase
MPADKYPFRSHTIPKEIETGKEALDADEIDAIIALEYPEGGWLWHTKNAFLFSLYCAGIRAGDLLRLRWRNIKDNGGRLEYVMGKNHKQKNIPLVPQARAILALYQTAEAKPTDYIFPLLDHNAKYAKYVDVDTMPIELKKELDKQVYSKNTLLNKHLKSIAFNAKIRKTLSFHISRHSFASLARTKAVPSKVVQEALAHSSLTTTERYLHTFSTAEVGNALQQVFNNGGTKEEALLQALKGLNKQELNDLLAKLQK